MMLFLVLMSLYLCGPVFRALVNAIRNRYSVLVAFSSSVFDRYCCSVNALTESLTQVIRSVVFVSCLGNQSVFIICVNIHYYIKIMRIRTLKVPKLELFYRR